MIRLFKVNMADEAIRAAGEVLSSGFIGQGPKVDAFEAALQKELNLPRRPITVNSGTTGLEMAYRLAGIGPNSIVISTPCTCLATNIPLTHLGATIVWADVDSRGLIDPRSVERLMERTAASAIVAVDWGGTPCNYRALRKAAPHLPIIQDAAHSYLTDFSETGMGDYVIWSFQAIKSLTTVDGGAVLTPDSQQDRARLLRWYGLDRSKSTAMRCTQQIEELGWKWHMNDVAAAIGMANMPWARKAVEKQRENASRIIAAIRVSATISVPEFDPRSAYWLLTVITNHENGQQRLIDYLDTQGIEASVVHARNDTQKKLRSFKSFPALDQVPHFSSREVCIPCGWWLTDPEIEKIINAIVDYDYL